MNDLRHILLAFALAGSVLPAGCTSRTETKDAAPAKTKSAAAKLMRITLHVPEMTERLHLT